MRFAVFYAALGWMVISLPSHANFSLSSGLFYLHGQTSTTDTTPISAWSVPITLSHYNQAWSWRVSTAWLQQSSDNATPQTVQGLGDTHFSLGYTSGRFPSLTTTLKYKLATGDATKGLSSGENDVGMQVDYFQSLQSGYSVFSTLGYSLNGKPTLTDVQNTAFVSAGLGKAISARWQAGFSLDYQQSLYASLNDQTALSLFAGYVAANQTSWGAMASYDNTQTMSLGISFQQPF